MIKKSLETLSLLTNFFIILAKIYQLHSSVVLKLNIKDEFRGILETNILQVSSLCETEIKIISGFLKFSI